MKDLVTLRKERDAALRALEAASGASHDAPDYQANFDTAAAVVEALDRDIANAERVQKLRGAARSAARAACRVAIPTAASSPSIGRCRRSITR